MKSQAIYVLGAPGSGKSTLVRSLMSSLGMGEEATQHDRPVPHLDHHNGWVEVGRRRETFSGTDALAMSIMPKATEWVRSDAAPERLIGEGARLGSAKFLRVVRDEYDSLVVLHLTGDPVLMYSRMLDRAAALGTKPQNEAWWRGRLTAARNAAAALGAVSLDVREPPDAVLAAALQVF